MKNLIILITTKSDQNPNSLGFVYAYAQVNLERQCSEKVCFLVKIRLFLSQDRKRAQRKEGKEIKIIPTCLIVAHSVKMVFFSVWDEKRKQ